MDYLYDENGMLYGFIYNNAKYFYIRDTLQNILGIVDANGNVVVNYYYSAYGECQKITGSKATTIGVINSFRYKGYYFDAETEFFYCNARYYSPEFCRFISPDSAQYLEPENVNGLNLYAYCNNDPIMYVDHGGHLANWVKVAIGAVATVAAVAVTVATGGAAAPVLVSVALSTAAGAAVSSVKHRITTGSWEGADKAALDGAANGFMLGGLGALGGSVIGGTVRTIANARSGITIGKTGKFEKVATLAQTRHYSGLKEFNFIKKVAGTKVAESIGWWQNKCVIKGVMALNGAIYDCGGALTGAYAKEVALTKGYQYLYNVWLM